MERNGSEKNLFVRTPLIESIALSDYCANKVFLKLENCQPSGSFKMRGISKLCQSVSLFFNKSIHAIN
jgi:L-serine/L-threonine ammonia-lyase